MKVRDIITVDTEGEFLRKKMVQEAAVNASKRQNQENERNLGMVYVPQDEIDSVYKRNETFLETIKEDRVQKAMRKGKYQSVEEAREKIAMPSLMSVVKHIVYKKSVAKNSHEERKAAVDYIIREIMGLTPVQFMTHYSVNNNKKYNLYHVINQIVDEAPDEIRIECAFNTKMTFFREMYPEVFGKELNQISGLDIFWCDEDIKAGLGKVANTEKYVGAKKAKYYGDIVDQVLMDAINEVMDDAGIPVGRKTFMALGEETSIYFGKHIGKNDRAAGINDLVRKRGYTSLLDFYFLNCDPKIQLQYVEDFMEVRDKCKNLPDNELLERLAKMKIYQKQREQAKDPEVMDPEKQYVKISDHKYRRSLGEKKYEFLEATPVENGDYLVYSGRVNLFKYSTETLRKIVEAQYGSQENFMREYTKRQEQNNTAEDIFPMVAEAVFSYSLVKQNNPLKTVVHRKVPADRIEEFLQRQIDRYAPQSDDIER